MIIPAPFGHLRIEVQQSAVSSVDFIFEHTTPTPIHALSALEENIAKQFADYFTNPHHKFSVKLAPLGSPFQRRAWEALREIPVGTTVTYGDLAKHLNTHPRAIGQACRNNPIPIIVPCHRVVMANSIGGYSGAGDGQLLIVKRWMLQHEGANSGEPPAFTNSK